MYLNRLIKNILNKLRGNGKWTISHYEGVGDWTLLLEIFCCVLIFYHLPYVPCSVCLFLEIWPRSKFIYILNTSWCMVFRGNSDLVLAALDCLFCYSFCGTNCKIYGIVLEYFHEVIFSASVFNRCILSINMYICHVHIS